MYVLFGLALLLSPLVLASLMFDVAPSSNRWMDIGPAVATLAAASVISFVFGFDTAKKKFRGRAIGLDGLTWPGTMLPQSKGYFEFLGKEDLGSQSLGMFRKVRKPQDIVTGLPQAISRNDILCVLSPAEVLPLGPCLLKVAYDLHDDMTVTTFIDPSRQRRDQN